MNFSQNNILNTKISKTNVSEDLKDKMHIDMEFPKLPYSFNALEPVIDSVTMRVHHNKHHKKYFDTMNEIIDKNSELKDKDIIDLLKNQKGLSSEDKDKFLNNAGGHFNHSYFWLSMSAEMNQLPSGKLHEDLKKQYGSFDKFKKEFIDTGVKHFGSGWVWLCVNDGKFQIKGFANQSNPYIEKCGIPVLGCDVWEHAYYLKYQNNREKYITNWFKVINWKLICDYYEEI